MKKLQESFSADERQKLFGILKSRFEKFKTRHRGIDWAKVQPRLEGNPGKLWSIRQMESTGGEPDLIAYDKKTDAYVFCDYSAESPSGRRNTCYDQEGLMSRKEHRPQHNAIDLAASMGINLLSEEEYHGLQQLGEFDLKTSSWLKTPADIRGLGGALFGDRRYGQVFVYHNGAQSYYAARGFRGLLKI